MMTGAWVSAALLVPLLLALGESTPDGTGETRKCGARINERVYYLLDGREVDSLTMKSVVTADLRDVSVRCINPVDLSIIPAGSKTPGVGAISMWTIKGPMAQVDALLLRINEAQRAHFEKSGSYALTLDALRLGEIPGEVQVSLDATADRWRANAQVNRPTSPRCVVFGGAHPGPMPGVAGFVRCVE